jgi:hypothetical protein
MCRFRSEGQKTGGPKVIHPSPFILLPCALARTYFGGPKFMYRFPGDIITFTRHLFLGSQKKSGAAFFHDVIFETYF